MQNPNLIGGRSVMLRVHFTSEDLLRTRLAAGPHPLWEAILSATLLGNRDGQAVFDGWRLCARSALRHLPPEQIRLIRCLAPPSGDFPDFLTPPQEAQDLAAGIEGVLSTPSQRIRQELAVLPRLPMWTRPLMDGEPGALRALGQSLRAYYTCAVGTHWQRIQALTDADRGVRARAVLHGGVEAMLESFRPTLRWNRPVLEADYPTDRDLRLAGRGLLLVPSVFCWRTPVTFIDPGLPPTLVYPVNRGPRWWAGHQTDPRRGQALRRLLGESRAMALRAVEDGCTTGELARRTGLALPTASQHATILREAGLIASTRRGNTVIHTLTPLGRDVLTANPG
ncbi:transcriptional regulator [Streptomyces griseoflavus]|uniref:ArsR/SmtB family transcription factor n=1 Tax=Streptomyces griseoflavus TaxID=35619 RepID=UPI00198CD154|nr:winged helix-turn-helix domain-containing protein [Streptomyces griseoflavus]GGV46279.1 transcriptional regulator [Streptomyces griseoflavus]